VITQQTLQRGKNGLNEQLRTMSISETEHPDYYLTQIPEHFDSYDVRKSPSDYIQDKLYEVVSEAFGTRRKVEKQMNRRDLLAFDAVLAKYLERDNIKTVMN